MRGRAWGGGAYSHCTHRGLDVEAQKVGHPAAGLKVSSGRAASEALGVLWPGGGRVVADEAVADTRMRPKETDERARNKIVDDKPIHKSKRP